MKAKEYADRFIASNYSDKELASIAFDMLMETKSLAEKRHIKTNSAMFAILNEIYDKWQAFVRLIPNRYLRSDGFAILIKDKMPEIYYYWIEYRKNTYRRIQS